MAKYTDSQHSASTTSDSDAAQQSNKRKIQSQQEQYHQLQRDLADAITRLASLDDIRILLACGARVDGPVTQGLHPIHYAAYQNFVPAVRLLTLRGCDINAMDDNGYTSVHLSAERGFYELLEFLIRSGARTNFTDSRWHGNPSCLVEEPLSLALKRDHLDCAELLLRNGANPNARYFMGSEINLISVLKVSCIKLLLEYGANPNSRDRSGMTPLMKAARHPHGYATVKLLIEHGADVNDITGDLQDFRTVLHFSIFSGNIDIIRLLLTSGARYPNLNFEKPSPMDIAIISGRPDIARLLIEFGADVNSGSNTTIGQPLQTVLTQGIENKREIVKLLLDCGADPNSPVTSNRNTGPPLADYLISVRSCACIGPSAPIPHSSLVYSGPDLEMVRLLLMYGARVVLKTPTQNRCGLVRTLEKIQEELSLDLLYLLIDAAEEIDWFMMAKVIYACLRHTNRTRANELFDPSVAADVTPERLRLILADQSAHHNGISEDLIRLMNRGKGSSSVLTLKQMMRLKVRKHLTDTLNLKGRHLIDRITRLPVPFILKKYLLFQS